jgi:hypothetical protein
MIGPESKTASVAGRIGPPDPFEEFQRRMLADLNPVGFEEESLARLYIQSLYRLQGAGADVANAPDEKALDAALRRERMHQTAMARLQGSFHRVRDRRLRRERAEAQDRQKAEDRAQKQAEQNLSPAERAQKEAQKAIAKARAKAERKAAEARYWSSLPFGKGKFGLPDPPGAWANQPKSFPEDDGPYDGWTDRLIIPKDRPTDGTKVTLKSSGLTVEHYLSLVADWWSPAELFREDAHWELSANDLRAMIEWAIEHGDQDMVERCGGTAVVKAGYDEADELGRRALFTFNPRSNWDVPGPRGLAGLVGAGGGRWVTPEEAARLKEAEGIV